MYVEQAFFQRFWREANDYDKNITRHLVKNGQLEFVNGGWCMHDEAAAHYIDMIDQTTLGHKFIVEQFGTSAVPTIGWQIDPFGHSATQAALLSGEVGFDGLFFGRIDYQDHDIRIAHKELEMIVCKIADHSTHFSRHFARG
jgi:alpha-mannosidase